MKQVIYDRLNFISNHLDEGLTLDIVAKSAGYSKYHFARIFKTHMGITLNEYIIERRLTLATKEILFGNRIIDVAIKYGYETHAGFGKAFKRKFGYSPHVLLVVRMVKTIFIKEGGIRMKSNDLYGSLLDILKKNGSHEGLKKVERAYAFACRAHEGQRRYSGEDYITHPLHVALLLAEMELSVDVVVLGLLHDLNGDNSPEQLEEIKKNFGIKMYEKLKRMNGVNLDPNNLNALKIEKDQDIIYVKLADRFHNMKTLKYLDQSRWREKAVETLEMFSPLADQLGLKEMKLELDQLVAEHI